MNRNKGTETENLTTAINLLVEQKQNSMRCVTFAAVTRVNTSTTGQYINHTINALPLVQERINTQYAGKKYESLPELYNIPYVSSTNPEVGQYCVLLHLDRSILGGNIQVIEKDGELYPLIQTKKSSHRLADCIAICGIQVDYLDERLEQQTQSTTLAASRMSKNIKNNDITDSKLQELESRIYAIEQKLNGGV